MVYILLYLLAILSVIVYLIPVEMKDAYETLQGRREEVGEFFDANLLEEAQNDTQKISAMRYVAGAMTHKVRKNA